MKATTHFVLAATALLLASCGIHSTIPASVTDPQAIELFNRAKRGEGEALYQIGLMYERGTHGFPKSRSRAVSCYKNAADAARPSAAACFKMYEYYNDNCNTDSKAADRDYYLKRASRYGDPRASQYFAAIEQTRKASEEASWRFHATHVNCPRCNGAGGRHVKSDRPIYKDVRVSNGLGQTVRWDSVIVGYEQDWIDCPHCEGGYVDKY